MKKYEIVKENTLFQDIIETGVVLKNKYYSIYYKDNGLKIPKFGLAVGKKCGNAVVRNKLKRQLRSILDHNRHLFLDGMNYIIMVRASITHLSYRQMEEFLIDLLEKEKVKNEKN